MFFDENIIEDDEYVGSICGHIDEEVDSEVLENYFRVNQRMTDSDSLILKSHIKNDTVSILMNIDVLEEYTSKGYGNELLNNFLDKSNSPIVLIVDTLDRSASFVEKWYERNGFETIKLVDFSLPVMIKY